jgi:hypothetical protein
MSDIVDAFEGSDPISLSKHFEYSRTCSKLLRMPFTEEVARRLIINVLNNVSKVNDDKSREIWADVIEAAGFYPYLDKEAKNLVLQNTPAEIRKEFHWSERLGVYFHEKAIIL